MIVDFAQRISFFMPWFIITTTGLAGLIYAVARDPWNAGYWLLLSAINVCVIMKG